MHYSLHITIKTHLSITTLSNATLTLLYVVVFSLQQLLRVLSELDTVNLFSFFYSYLNWIHLFMIALVLLLSLQVSVSSSSIDRSPFLTEMSSQVWIRCDWAEIFFDKIATNLADLLFIELMSHLSHGKQMYSHPIHFTHELVLCIQITRGRVDFNGNSAAKSPCWHRVSNLRPSRLMLLNFSVQMGPSVLKIKMEILVV